MPIHRAGRRCFACGRQGGHPGRRTDVECPVLGRAVVEQAKRYAYRCRRWAAGDDGAFEDPLDEVLKREERELKARQAQQEAEEGAAPQAAAEEEQEPAPAAAAVAPSEPPGFWTRLRWWVLGWRDHLERKLQS